MDPLGRPRALSMIAGMLATVATLIVGSAWAVRGGSVRAALDRHAPPLQYAFEAHAPSLAHELGHPGVVPVHRNSPQLGLPGPLTLAHQPLAQASHGLEQLRSQQTPATQKPDAHWFCVEHTAPSGLSAAQVPVPTSQNVPAAHVASVAQLVGQPPCAPEHTKGAQGGVPGKPGGAFAHVPASAAQSSHAPAHVPLQQTPSTHEPLAHAAQPAAKQSAPAATLHATPWFFCALHLLSAAQ